MFIRSPLRYTAVGIVICAIAITAQAAAPVVRIANLEAYDVVYEPYSQRLYASVNSTDPTYGNSIAVINPVTGAIEGSAFVGSGPRKLAVSSDGQYIYVGLYGAGKVSRFNVASTTVDQEFSLGTGSYGTTYVEDIAVQPGNPYVIAVSRYRKGASPRHDGVAIYDNGIIRPQITGGYTRNNVIEFSDSPDILYGYCNETTGFGVYTNIVNDYGVALGSAHSFLISGFGVDIEYDGGRLYATSGRVVDTSTMQLAGTFATSGKVEPDYEIRRTFFINGSTITAYNQETFVSTGQVSIPGVSGSPRNLVRWGNRGLAFCTSGSQVVIVETDLVVDPAVLTSLVIEGPDHVSTYRADYKLIATFDDGVILDITKQARWMTDPDTYTEIDGSGSLAVFGTEEPGDTTVKAEYVWAGVTYETFKDISYAGTIPATGNLIRLEINGPDQVLKESSAQYSAIAYFDDDSEFDVTESCVWSMEPSEFANLDEHGVLSVGDISRYRDVVIYAKFGHKYTELDAVKTVLCVPDITQIGANNWPMYQANAQHTGYLPMSLDPEDFSLRWEQPIGNGYTLNPVTAANGKVFVSLYVRFDDIPALFTLDARDGEVLWSEGFGRVNSVNPPSYAYGTVYIQTGKESSSGIPPYLHAFDADTGEFIFRSIFSAQWERYQSPTIYDGSVYVNGGYYGGMYGFDAFSGEQQWFRGLRQDDNWTPAVEAQYAYSFVEGYFTAVNRLYGTTAWSVYYQDARYRTCKAVVLGEMKNALVITVGHLVSFDLANEDVGWSIPANFTGLPSVANGVIYAINGGSLEARSEVNGDLLWNWDPPEGALTDTMVLTDTHLIARTSDNTYAIELLSRQQDWSYPASGPLALGNDTLYIAGSNGVLTAIAMPEYVSATPVKLEIEGPSEITESSTTAYKATVYYDDGRIRNRTELSDWNITGPDVAAMDNFGALSVGQLLYPEETIVLRAEYTENDVTMIDEIKIAVNIGCTVSELVVRNLEDALKFKQQILLDLEQALAREYATTSVIQKLRHGGVNDPNRLDLNKAVNQTKLAVVKERLAKKTIDRSVDNLCDVLEIFSADSPYLEDTRKFKEMLSLTFQEEVQNADINGDGAIDMLDILEISRFWLHKGRSPGSTKSNDGNK